MGTADARCGAPRRWPRGLSGVWTAVVAVAGVMALFILTSLGTGGAGASPAAGQQPAVDWRESLTEGPVHGPDLPGGRPRATCADCHAPRPEVPGAVPRLPARLSPVTQTACAACHAGPAADVTRGAHGLAAAGPEGAPLPACSTCHGTHGILPATALAGRIGSTCADCHPGPAAGLGPPHQGAVSRQGPVSCASCHRSHAVLDFVGRPEATTTSCATCHRTAGRELASSVHGATSPATGLPAASCASCHRGHATGTGAAAPSRAATACATCHQAVPARLAGTAHAQVACVTCHGSHGVAGDPVVATGAACVSCHASAAARLAGTPHGPGTADGAGVSCASCHGVHPDPAAKPPEEMPAALGIAGALDQRCAGCHAEAVKTFLTSFHAAPAPDGRPAATCTDCHAGHLPATDRRATSQTKDMPPVATGSDIEARCATCHQQAGASLAESAHAGLDGSSPDPQAPGCLTCHPGHEGLPPAANRPAALLALAESRLETCRSCHEEPAKGFGESVHAEADPASGRLAYCFSCHTAHAVQPIGRTPAERGKFWLSMAENCSHCHEEPGNGYRSSAHRSVLEDGWLAASCRDCHGGPARGLALEAPAALAHTGLTRDVAWRDPERCLACHEGIRPSWEYSFHGVTYRKGWDRAPDCLSCHEGKPHAVLAMTDPRSTVHPDNVPETCARCHRLAQPNFARGLEHVTPRDRDRAFPMWAVYKFFMALILFDVVKDGPIVVLELVRRLKRLNRRGGNRHGH